MTAKTPHAQKRFALRTELYRLRKVILKGGSTPEILLEQRNVQAKYDALGDARGTGARAMNKANGKARNARKPTVRARKNGKLSDGPLPLLKELVAINDNGGGNHHVTDTIFRIIRES